MINRCDNCKHLEMLVNQGITRCELNRSEFPQCEQCSKFEEEQLSYATTWGFNEEINNALQIDDADCALSYGDNHMNTSTMWTDQAYRTIEFTGRFEWFGDKMTNERN